MQLRLRLGPGRWLRRRVVDVHTVDQHARCARSRATSSTACASVLAVETAVGIVSDVSRIASGSCVFNIFVPDAVIARELLGVALVRFGKGCRIRCDGDGIFARCFAWPPTPDRRNPHRRSTRRSRFPCCGARRLRRALSNPYLYCNGPLLQRQIVLAPDDFRVGYQTGGGHLIARFQRDEFHALRGSPRLPDGPPNRCAESGLGRVMIISSRVSLFTERNAPTTLPIFGSSSSLLMTPFAPRRSAGITSKRRAFPHDGRSRPPKSRGGLLY